MRDEVRKDALAPDAAPTVRAAVAIDAIVAADPFMSYGICCVLFYLCRL